jgi:nicotinamide mononucleotide adenylyltransferase
MYAYELYEQNSPRVVVTYPGRFQPFHQGHAGVFEILQKKFGSENVYILTSNDTSSSKSPFNFSDKYQLMTAAGIPADRIIETNKMYELPEQFNKNSTIFITVVGAPDAKRLNPDSYYKKDQIDKATGEVRKAAGSPTYYKTWNDKEQPSTADEYGYVVVIPELQKTITIGNENYDVSHGTDVRNLWNDIRDNDDLRREFLSKMYRNPRLELGTIFDKIPQSTVEDISPDGGDTTSPIHGRYTTLNEDVESIDKLKKSMRNFLPIATKILGIKLPKGLIVFKRSLQSYDGQASFGRFVPEKNRVFVAVSGRHPVDILRTLAHELTHYKQHLRGELDEHSGKTGSNEENYANATAGIIMRIYNKRHSDAISDNR